MYSASLGRFLQTDPIGYADGINWYMYCGNNPIVLTDPFGYCGQDSSVGLVGSWLWWHQPRSSDERVYSVQQTESILESVRHIPVYLTHFGPAGHSVPPCWGGYDFKLANDMFTVMIDGKPLMLSGSEFSNVLAGYAGRYYGGDVGLTLTFMAGDYFARQDGLPEDDYESRRDIVRGYHLAIEHEERDRRLFRQIIGDMSLSDFYWMGL
jgi:hypothetical protein